MLLDRKIIDGDYLGPGDPGDFDKGAWHVLCHLAGGCAVFKIPGALLWVEISHVPVADIYTATVTVSSTNESVCTFPLLSDEGNLLLKNAVLLGFVEGSSLGHISARDVIDNEIRFNLWKRQDFDMDIHSDRDGGRVWEHWCTVRDLTQSAALGISVLKSYLSIVSLCGGKYVSIVARGRRDYAHPNQLLALVEYGFISKIDALINITPKPIPQKAQDLIYTANPVNCIKAAATLPWKENEISYFMFERRIASWSTTSAVEKDFQNQ
ncbi:MAG: hypothetical protein PHN88_15015 [Ignavibacteria bacterium]|nr:hypothetical protein [Ignavibacteria bacterium]